MATGEKYLPCSEPGCSYRSTPEALPLHLLYQHAKDLGLYTIKAAKDYLKAKREEVKS